MGPRRSSLHSVRFEQLLVTPNTLDIYKYLMSLVTLCTSRVGVDYNRNRNRNRL